MTAKELARAIDCDPRTAENILAGTWPSARHWQGIARAFGRDVLDAVFDPEFDDVSARLKAEVADLERQLLARRAQLMSVEDKR